MILNPTPVSTRDLSYDAKTGTFTAEASSLPAPGRVYDDACDFGYTVISHLSGTKVVFVEDFQQRDRDDILYTVYLPTHESGRRIDGIRLHVFND